LEQQDALVQNKERTKETKTKPIAQLTQKIKRVLHTNAKLKIIILLNLVYRKNI
jgi:hypothetical protein